jgi:hypothetical protein
MALPREGALKRQSVFRLNAKSTTRAPNGHRAVQQHGLTADQKFLPIVSACNEARDITPETSVALLEAARNSKELFRRHHRLCSSGARGADADEVEVAVGVATWRIWLARREPFPVHRFSRNRGEAEPPLFVIYPLILNVQPGTTKRLFDNALRIGCLLAGSGGRSAKPDREDILAGMLFHLFAPIRNVHTYASMLNRIVFISLMRLGTRCLRLRVVPKLLIQDSASVLMNDSYPLCCTVQTHEAEMAIIRLTNVSKADKYD